MICVAGCVRQRQIAGSRFPSWSPSCRWRPVVHLKIVVYGRRLAYTAIHGVMVSLSLALSRSLSVSLSLALSHSLSLSLALSRCIAIGASQVAQVSAAQASAAQAAQASQAAQDSYASRAAQAAQAAQGEQAALKPKGKKEKSGKSKGETHTGQKRARGLESELENGSRAPLGVLRIDIIPQRGRRHP
jgi:hypothetical protein